MIRLGLFLYDTLGGRKILPGPHTINLMTDPAGRALNPKFQRAYEYSDVWVEDSRLVVLNAREARIKVRTKATAVVRKDDL